jgi:hypothetical protein
MAPRRRLPPMPAAAKPIAWLPVFTDFMSRLRIDSKEVQSKPGENGVALKPYGSQMRFLKEIATGLDTGKRFFVNLKARQLGTTTIVLVVDLFWLSMFPGLQGALITDSEDNKEVFRHTIERYLESLPDGYKIAVKHHNRTMLELENGSVLQYLVAGTKGKKALGTSRGLNFVHATEVAKWSPDVGLDSLMAALAETHPHRLYIFESTAMGFNHFRHMWKEAQADPHTQHAFFIGWWAKEIYSIPKSDPRFAEYMQDAATEEEQEKARIVYESYGFAITAQQLAWYRWRESTRTYDDGAMAQEFPWHEEEAFVVTGNHFFPGRRLTEDYRRIMDGKSVMFKAYRYRLGEHISSTDLDTVTIEQVKRSGEAHLKIWEEPVAHGSYAIGFDPAYGRNDFADRHAISVWRCYADRFQQCAEYATPDPLTYQVTWVLAHLAAMYRNCIINLEVNGPGGAVLQELDNIKRQMRAFVAQNGEPAMPRDFGDALSAARWYLYHRPDSFGAGYVKGWKTGADNKMTIMNQLRDTYDLRMLGVMSGPLVEEMETIVQDGSEIGAYGRGKDDRVFAAAFAHKAWIEWVRPGLVMQGKTYARALEAEAAGGVERATGRSFTGNIVVNHFQRQEAGRRDMRIAQRFGGRRR